MWELFFSHHITYLTFTSHHLPHLTYTGSPSHIPHIHWVARQNKLEAPKEKDKVRKREVHECDVRTRDPL